MRLNKLSLQDKKIFNKYLGLSEHELSVYSFANIYIWRKLFSINWSIIEDNLCIFFQNKIAAFLYLAPLGKDNNPEVIKEVFKILTSLNKNPEFAHIENVERKDINFYQGLGYKCSHKSHDYLCKRNDLAALCGDKFKSKRASYNYFTKHYDFEYRSFSPKLKKSCLKLYSYWMKMRASQNQDHIYQGLMQDSRLSLKEALDNYQALDLRGGAVKVGKEIKGFTLGFAINPDSFCILYEITDLAVKGLAQFIFRKFSSDLEGYKYINIMDDSGLENLKKVKLSYHPVRLIPAYIVKKKNE
ncbi:MAG: phosphatidylglycerol lysyltransferase domain-containing protein [Candidatus Omnitrophica bacterium]|nr:phosphatidylglycerol lysyltransferase domain-containing protein [Candidatus Omnitrophota bacterium]